MLPINSEFAPMEAQLVETIPSGGNWQYEPKRDGFRCLIFRDGDRIEMRSKSGQILDRYFPEVVAAAHKLHARQFVLDGELVISVAGRFSFDDLLERIHPAATRIKELSLERPATLILFDLLVDDRGRNLIEEPMETRRAHLEKFTEKFLRDNQDIVLSPAVTDYNAAQKWWQMVGHNLDGLVAKRLGMPYQSGNRKGMVNVKRMRTADCVVGGFRYAESGGMVGSLLLGLYDDQGKLNHVGYTSAFKAAERQELLKVVEPLALASGKGSEVLHLRSVGDYSV